MQTQGNYGAFQVSSAVKNLPTKQEMQVQSLGWEDTLEKEMATYSSLLAEKSHGQKSLAGYSPWGHTEWTRLSDFHSTAIYWDVCGSAGKESACNVGALGSIPGLGRSPGEGNGYSLQYSCLENPLDMYI